MQILVVVLALTATPKLLALSSTLLEPVFAQTNSPSPIPLPQSLPSGTTVKVDGSSSMRVINEALKKRFEEKFAGTKVDLASGGTDQALAALLRGDINLAAVGRPLTDQEKAQGLITTPVSREKIAIIVGSDNAFNQNLTFEQFAQMFRGEITDWAKVGGKPGKIRFVDHPDLSDTRRSLSTYNNFKKFPFQNGANTTRLSQDDTATIVRELGSDGISYAIADQVINLPNVRVISMHKTLPNDPRYPYSQPRGYVYRKETSAPGMLAFLGFATSAPGQEIVAAAKQQEAEAVRQSTTTTAKSPASSPAAATSPSPAPTAPTALVPPASSNTIGTTAVDREREFPWWLLLLAGIPLLGLFWWLLRRGQGSTAAVEDTNATPITTSTNTNVTGTIPTTSLGTTRAETTAPSTNATSTTQDIRENPLPETPVTPVGFGVDRATGLGIAGLTAGALGVGAALAGRRLGSRITLEPRNSREANAVWSAPQADREVAKQQGGRQFQLRIYDVTGIDIDTQAPHSMQSYDCDEISQERLIPIQRSDRDYVAEIGYVTPEGRWLLLARSNSVRVASPLVEHPNHHVEQHLPEKALGSNITLELLNLQEAEAVWSAPQAHREAAKQEGGRRFQLRIYDATNINLDDQLLYSTQSYDCDELDHSRRIVPIAQSDRDYVAEIGYLTNWGQWLILARSNAVKVNSTSEAITPEIPETAEVDPVETTETFRSATEPNELTQLPDPNIATPAVAGVIATGAAGAIATGAAFSAHSLSSRITLEPSSSTEANAQWSVPPADREWAIQQGGQQFELRIYDVTDIDLDRQPAWIVQSEECDEHSQQQQVSLPMSDRDYVAEIGYLTEDEQWLRLACSNSVRVVAVASSLTQNLPEPNIVTPAVAGVIATGVAGAMAGSAASSQHSLSSRITLEPSSSTEANAQWSVPVSDQEWALQQGGQQFELRIYDVTDIDLDRQPAWIVQSEECDEHSQQQQVSLPMSDRDYVAEIGYLTEDEEWLRLARSKRVRVATSYSSEITQHQMSSSTTQESRTTQTHSRVVLINGSNQSVWVQWEVLREERETAMQQGGQIFQLRIYDATHINLDTQLAQSVHSYDCDERSQQQQVSVPVGDRDYVAEIGYVTSSDQWLRIARSNHVRVPSFGVQHSRVTQSGCKVQHLTIHSRNNGFLLDEERMRKLQETAVSKTLEPGIYVVRIRSGSFGYHSAVSQVNQPIVLLWIYGRIINKKTNVPVPATWSSLNGYDDTLTLEVVETSTLCAFFFDSHVDDNDGEVIVSVVRLYSKDLEQR